jgi:aerotaxis receptor
MRVNLPITQEEFPFPNGALLVSTTDPQGRILYCNPDFIRVSGFSGDELLGQPHNLVRHPDMPEEAFRDMWETLGSGRPWSGLVKNRRKDGRHYWVNANVTPLFSAGQITGFLSVRVAPDRAAVEAAEALYARMRQEKESGRLVHRLDGGAVWRDSAGNRIMRAIKLGPAARLGMWGLVLGGTASAAVAAAALAGWPVAALTALALLGAAGVAAGVAMAAQQTILSPIRALVPVANQLAAGDLTVDVAASGTGVVAELGRALSQMSVNLRAVVGDATREVARMKAGAAEIAAGNQDLASRTESQAANLQETAASMEEITGTVRQSVASAEQANQLAERASHTTRSGSEALTAVTTTMQDISQGSARIGEIIGVIEGIAFQTNILALNAAVEAARAGEQGRGFAVVASEVRALAQRTSGAAKEVRELITASAQQVRQGAQLSDNAMRTMTQVLESVQEVTAVIETITTSASEQMSGMSQINEAVAQMDSITQRNAGLVEEVAASAMDLNQQAEAVANAMAVFTLQAHAARSQPTAVGLRKAAKARASQAA